MLNNLISEIKQLKESQKNMAYSNQQLATVDALKKQRYDLQPQTMTGMYTALVVSTIDPLKKGRVRWYNPLLVNRNTPLEGLPWASPVSAFGGFDDSGSIWVPPAGSSIVLFFLAGNRDCAHYIGTIWNQNRGPDGQHLEYWDNNPIDEYATLYDGKRGGYNFGDNSGSQVHPPWNTEMYNGFDNDSTTDFYANQTDYASATTPYIYGFKTVQKHGMKHVDGDSNCNYRWRRSEWFTGCGNTIMMKDDHLHPAGQWAYGTDTSLVYCRENQLPKEYAICDPEQTDSSNCSVSSSQTSSTVKRTQVFANPFYKRKEEQRLYEGAPTPMNNKCELPQSGIHIQSLSGNQVVLDDSVNQPKGIPTWEREFDFGCDDIYKGKMHLRSATGHYFGLQDEEDYPKNRSSNNGIFLKTAAGNSMVLGDHTVYAGSCECPPNNAGSQRGFEVQTTSTHLFKMSDEGLSQCSEARMDGGEPKKHDKPGFEGYCMLRSGYGLQLLMKDAGRQDETDNQFIEILAPQTDNQDRGPHMFVMQEKKEGPGVVMLRAGGTMYINSYDDSVEVVGTEDNEANKFTSITGSCLHDTKGSYYNHSDTCLFFAENFIYLIAGTDNQNAEADNGNNDITAAQAAPGTTEGKTKNTSLAPAIVAKDPWVCPFTSYVHFGVLGTPSATGGPQLDSRSKHVFASP